MNAGDPIWWTRDNGDKIPGRAAGHPFEQPTAEDRTKTRTMRVVEFRAGYWDIIQRVVPTSQIHPRVEMLEGE